MLKRKLVCYNTTLMLKCELEFWRRYNATHMRNDSLEIFWSTYQEEAWKKLNDMRDSPITTEDVNTFAVEAITSLNKNEIIKKLAGTVDDFNACC